MEARTRTATRLGRRGNNERDPPSDVALFSASVNVNQREMRSLSVAGLNGNDALVVFRSNFQLGHRAGVLIALQLLALTRVFVIIVHFHVAVVLLRVTLQHFAV